MILAIFYLQMAPILPTKFQVNWPFDFQTIGLSVQEKKSKMDFQ